MPLKRSKGRVLWLLALGSLLLATLFGALAYNDTRNHEALWRLQLDQQSEVQARAVLAAQRHLQGQAELIAGTLAADVGVQTLMRQSAALLEAGTPWNDARLYRLRNWLVSELQPFWLGMQAHEARQLALYVGPQGTTLLRMHARQAHGDDEADRRPLLARALDSASVVSGIDIGPFGAGNRAIAPIHATQDPASPVIGALEVGFGLLPPLPRLSAQLDAGVALLLNQQRMAPVMRVPLEGIAVAGQPGWLLDTRSPEQAVAWAEAGLLADPDDDRTTRLLRVEGRAYLLRQVPLDGSRQADSEAPPLAVALVWRDITDQLAEQRTALTALQAKWTFAWLIAEGLLLIVLLLYHRRTRVQQRHRDALRTLNEIASLPPTGRGGPPLGEALARAATYLRMAQAQLIRYDAGEPRVVQALGGLDGAPSDALLRRIEDCTGQGRPLTIEDATGHALEPGSSLIATALPGEAGSGAVLFASAGPRRWRFDDADMEFMRLFAGWLAATLERERQEHDRLNVLGRAQKIASHLPGAMYQLERSPDGRYRFLYASEGTEAIFGFTPEALMADASLAFACVHPDDLPQVEAGLVSSAQSLLFRSPEYRLIHPTKGVIWVEVRATPESHPDGSVHWHGFIADISERKAIEQRLVEEHQRGDATREATRAGTWEWNVPEGRMIVDAGWGRIFGEGISEPTDTAYATWQARVHPEDGPEFGRRLRQNLGTPDSLFEHDFRARHRDGRWIWIRVRGRVLERTADGAPLRMYGVITDITEARTQQQLMRETRAYLEAVVQASTEVAIVATDAFGRITLFNAGAERLLALSAEHVVGQVNAADLLPAEELEERARALSAALQRPISGFDALVEIPRSGTPETRHWTYRRPDGNQRLINLTVTAIRDNQGALSGYLGIATDITELLETTRALQKSESRFRAMVSNLPGVLYRCANDSQRTLNYLSEGMERLSGYPAADFIRHRVRRYLDIIHPEDRREALDAFNNQQARQEGWEHSYRLVRADGEVVWVREKSRPQHDRNGQVLGYDGFIWDVTERVQAELSTLEREDYLRKLIANVIDGIIIIDQRGQIETFNHAAERIFGYRSEELLGRNVNVLMPQPTREAHDGYLLAYHQRGESQALEMNREMVAQRRSGETFPIELRVSQISHRGERKFIGLVRDITERKRIEQMKNEFVSIVSHELRTPLTSITGALGLATGGALGELTPTQQQMLGIAYQNSQRLARLIDDLLDMDKLVAGKMTFQLERQPLAPILQQAVRMSDDYARQHQVGFVLHPVDPAWQVRVDEVRLHQVMANFLSNAAKFSPAGDQVEVLAEPRDGWVRVTVADRGPGITPAFHARIFQKFSQADSSDTRQKGGTGLGLAISKELVERMQGRIGFDSEPGQGARFWFELPRVEATDERHP